MNSEQWIKVDIANQLGKDKLTWEERIQYVDAIKDFNKENPEKPILYKKAVQALKDCRDGVPSGFIMGLDSTSSGLQLMAVLTKDEVTGKYTNLTKTGKREDIYTEHFKAMKCKQKVTRKEIKQASMTSFYASKATPEALFPDKTVLNDFYAAMSIIAPLPTKLVPLILGCWDSTVLHHTWTLPDGHYSHVKVMVPDQFRVEVQELDNKSFTYHYKKNAPSTYGKSILANIIQSVDGYVCRQMIERLNQKNIPMLCIHDSFWGRPKHMNEFCNTYKNILAELLEENLLERILYEVTGKQIKIPQGKLTKTDILESEYAIC